MASDQRYNFSMTALMIGVPVLVGAGCYYLYVTRDKTTAVKSKSDKKLEPNKPLTLIEQVMQIKQLGNQNFARKNYEAAIELYTKAIELAQSPEANVKPDDLAVFFQNRAACYEALGKFEQALEDCDKAIEFKKTYTKAYVRRAKVCEKLKYYDKAMLSAFAANLLEKFQNQTTMILTDSIVREVSKQKAVEAMKSYVPDWPSNQTIKAYFSAFVQDPVKQRLGNQEVTNAAQLQPIFDEACKPENDNDPLSILIRGTCYSLRSVPKKAAEAFHQLLDMSDDVCSPKLKANALIKQSAIVLSVPSESSFNIEKELAEVHTLLDKAIEIDPENPDAYLHKAQALTLCEKFDEAVKNLEKAIELKGNFHSAIAQKFYIELKMATNDSLTTNSRAKGMLNEFKKIVDENPESTDLLQMYSQVLTELSQFEQADQMLLKLSKLDPQDGGVYVSRGLLQFHLKSDPESVAALLKEAVKIDPKIIMAYEILGSIETQMGKPEESIKTFETALKCCQTEAEFARCFSNLEAAKCQKAATELLGLEQ